MRRLLLTLIFMLSLASASLATAQTPASPTGDWHGTLQAGAVKLRLAMHLGSTSTFDSLDQGALGIPATMTTMTTMGRHVTVTIERVGVFEADLSEDGRSLVGTLRQGPSITPLSLERGNFAAANRPQTPIKPYPYRSEEVGYDNPKRVGVHLAGTLTLPPGAGPFPAVLLITGSGAQDRDETIFEHKPFLVLSDNLTRRGIAVLRVDDRGRGGSTGAGPGDTSADFATDVEAGVAWLKTRADIDKKRIGLLGHSEGGIIAPLVASRDPSIAFLVLWAGPGVSGADILVEQIRAINLAAGATAAVADTKAKLERALMDAMLKAGDPEAARAALAKVYLDAGMPAPGAAELRQLTAPWFMNFVAYDPAPALRALKVPVLALLGGKDVQVPSYQNAPALSAALKGNRKARVVSLANLNHLFQTAATGSVDDYGKIEETIAPEALKMIGDWIVANTTR